MKMTWLHMLFGLFFVPADSWAKSAQQLKTTVLLFHSLYFSWPVDCFKIMMETELKFYHLAIEKKMWRIVILCQIWFIPRHLLIISSPGLGTQENYISWALHSMMSFFWWSVCLCVWGLPEWIYVKIPCYRTIFW